MIRYWTENNDNNKDKVQNLNFTMKENSFKESTGYHVPVLSLSCYVAASLFKPFLFLRIVLLGVSCTVTYHLNM